MELCNTCGWLEQQCTCSAMTDKEALKRYCALTAEVAELKTKLTLMHQSSDERDDEIIRETATRCAEIAADHVDGMDSAKAIRKEYGLEP